MPDTLTLPKPGFPRPGRCCCCCCCRCRRTRSDRGVGLLKTAAAAGGGLLARSESEAMALWCRPRCCCCSCAASSRTARLLSSLRSCGLESSSGSGGTNKQPDDELAAPALKTAVSNDALGANGGQEGNEWVHRSLVPAEEPIPGRAPGAQVKEEGVAPGRGRSGGRKRLWEPPEAAQRLKTKATFTSPDALRYGATVMPRYPLSLVGMVFVKLGLIFLILKKRREEEEKTRSGKGSVFQAWRDE